MKSKLADDPLLTTEMRHDINQAVGHSRTVSRTNYERPRDKFRNAALTLMATERALFGSSQILQDIEGNPSASTNTLSLNEARNNTETSNNSIKKEDESVSDVDPNVDAQ